jgi:hypothetical protein
MARGKRTCTRGGAGATVAPVNSEEMQTLGDFYRQLADAPLDPASDKRYVPLYGDGPDAIGEDPVELLARAIQWLPGESSQLLSGFRGTGKSTELRRLRNRLRDGGYHVALLDMEQYVNTSTPIDVSDFLITLAGAAGEALADPDLLGLDETKEGYWTRFAAFLSKTKLEVGDASPGFVKLNLRSDPTFRQEVQARLAGHVGALFRDVCGFFEHCLKRLKGKHGDGAELVLIVDSLDHIRGTSANEADVQASVENLFAAHANKLRIPNVHVIYTVPVYLKVRYPKIGTRYGAGEVPIFPAVKVRHEASGDVHAVAVAALRRVVASRGDVQRVFGGDALLDRVILASGGHFRDLMTLVASVLQRARTLPVDEEVVESALNSARIQMVPIPDQSARWLATIAQTHSASVGDEAAVQAFTRFLDTGLVLCYRDGPEWYDVHPLVKDLVVAQVAALDALDQARGASSPASARGGPGA